ncbi:carbohydrate binding domain-containing protein [Actinoplanes teichomyceticus]|uniref:Carbohydrate binding protein n=1 Tax=Actinoplanes teichomyceticus TaxID=1867 RepID=A0A561WAS7_ACTTI|nr:carbohydrate binding domain-containing protein [Actinoplanes teichomyceticus]TWG20960.1 carbohydrate binding protein [Actinoplanes teichomyceticus]GIF16546.1 hypothetical protein Ate01nite_65780 [Actinoplanes teichomyceticus]
MTIAPANSNAYFETDAAGWTAFGGTAARSTAQAHQGAASLLLTADGSATSRVESNAAAGVTPGTEWRADAWVRCSVSRGVSISINWYNSSFGYLSTSTTVTTAVTANTWTQLAVAATAPAGAARAAINVSMTGTPASGTLLYVDESMVRPAAVLTATPEPGNAPPRVLLQLEYIGATSATIVRTDPDGTSSPVRLAEPATLDGSSQWVGYDYESWFGAATTWTATTSTGAFISAPATLTVADIWLRHPGVPSLSQKVDFQGEGTPVRGVVQAVLQPLGRATPIVVSDGVRKAKQGTITIRTKTDAEADALLALLKDLSQLLLDIPPEKQYGSTLRHQYLSIGELTESRLRPDYYPHPWRIWTAPYVAVGRPAGGIVSQRTYTTVLAQHANYQDALARYGTYTDLLTGA